MVQLLSIFAVLTSLAGTLVSASHAKMKRNRDVAVGYSRDEATGLSVFKRVDNARFTYYKDGLGACGKTNAPNDFIVALNSAQFEGGKHCFEMITINYQGKTTQAQIMDECSGCPINGLDFSQGLFDFFASEASGVLYGHWDFGNTAPAPAPAPAPTPALKPSLAPPPPPKPFLTPPIKIDEKHSALPPPPSTTQAKPMSSKAKSSFIASSLSTPSPTVAIKATPSASNPTPTNKTVEAQDTLSSQVATGSSVVYEFNAAFLGLSGLLLGAAMKPLN